MSPNRRNSESNFQGTLFVVRDISGDSLGEEDTKKLILETLDRIKQAFRYNDQRTYGTKIRTGINPSDITKSLAHQVREKVVFGEKSALGENIALNTVAKSRAELIKLLGGLSNNPLDKMIVIASFEWIKQLRMMGEVPGISHSSTRQEWEEVVFPGSVLHLQGVGRW